MKSLVSARESIRSLILKALIPCLLAITAPVYAEDGEPKGAAPVVSEVHRYVVRGTIRQLPAKPGGELFIRHEPIPDYMNREGKVVGMHAMTMPFWVADGVSIDGLAPGDQVEFTFESQWHPRPEDKIVAIRKIDAES